MAFIGTDLSAAFDVVPHAVLLKKLHYYGIDGHELELLQSYLEDRVQFVKLDTQRRLVKVSPEASVVQGSKLSGLLYTVSQSVHFSQSNSQSISLSHCQSVSINLVSHSHRQSVS